MMQSRTRTPDSRKTVVGGRGATRKDKRRPYNIMSNRIILYYIGTARAAFFVCPTPPLPSSRVTRSE